MDQTSPAYVAAVEDDFTVESNAPSEAVMRAERGLPEIEDAAVETTGAPAVKEAAQTAAAAASETSDKTERTRDDAGRFKSAKSDESDDDEAIEAKPDDKADKAAKDAKAEKKPTPRNDPEKRIEQAIARQREAERRADAAEQRAKEIEQRTAPRQETAARPTERPAPSQARTDDPEPQEAEFQDYGQFIDAKSRWAARDEHRKLQAQTQQRAAMQHAQRERHDLTTKFSGAIDAAVTADPEFLRTIAEDVLSLPTFDALREGERPTPAHFVGEELLRASDATALMRHWTAHPDEFQALASLPPREITRRIAATEARLDAARATRTAPETPQFSQAKPPVKRVAGSPVVSDESPGEDADLDSHIRFYNAKDSRRR